MIWRGRGLLWILLALAIYFIATVAGSDRYPRVWVDEGWIAEPAWTFAHDGPLASPSHGPLHEYDQRLYWMPPLYFLALSISYSFASDPLLAGRMVSMAFGALGLMALLHLGKRLVNAAGGNQTQVWWMAWLILAFTLDPTLWKVHRSIRFEAMTGTFLLATVLVATASRGWTAWVGSGVLSALGALTHPTGALAFPIAIGILVFRQGRSSQGILGAVGAFGIVLAPYLVYLAQDRAAGFSNLLGQNAPHMGGEAPPLPFLREWIRFRNYFALPWLLVPLLLWGVTIVLGVRARAPRWLLWTIAVLLGGLACLPNKSELYLTLVAPFLYLLAVWMGSRLGRRAWGWAGAAIWVLILAAADAALLARDRECRYEDWTAPLAAALPPGTSVAGTFVTWFAAREHPYFEFHRRRAGDLADVRPDRVMWGDTHSTDPMFSRLRAELGSFLAAHSDTMARSVSRCYGDAVVLRPRWDELDPRVAVTWERFGKEEPDL